MKRLISGVRGFVSYAAVRSGDGGMTVTVCQDKAGTDESSRRAAGWVKENVSAGPTHPSSLRAIQFSSSAPEARCSSGPPEAGVGRAHPCNHVSHRVGQSPSQCARVG